MAFIHKLNSNDYILCDIQGNIKGMGQLAAELFDLEPSFIESKIVNIMIFAPKLAHFFKNVFVEKVMDNLRSL
jgi:hypothetical protein